MSGPQAGRWAPAGGQTFRGVGNDEPHGRARRRTQTLPASAPAILRAWPAGFKSAPFPRPSCQHIQWLGRRSCERLRRFTSACEEGNTLEITGRRPGARDGNRTRTARSREILSLLCLPVSPPGLPVDYSDWKKEKGKQPLLSHFVAVFLERQKSLELSTYTLARYRSTN